MAHRRDRHGRGMRGPIANTNSYLGRAVPLLRRTPPGAYFDECVTAAVARVRRHCPEALQGVSVGVEDVPTFTTGWDADRVPLAAAVEATPDTPANVVLYRRPLERRADTRRGLAILVHRTLVEQLSATTGRTVGDLDPEGWSDDDVD